MAPAGAHSAAWRAGLKRLATGLLFCLLCLPAQAGLVTAEVGDDYLPLGKYLHILRDESGKLDASAVLQQRDGWQTWKKDSVSLGMDRADFWFRVTILNRAPFPRDMLLEIAYPSLDQVTIYEAVGDTLVSQVEMCDSLPFSQRPVNHHYFVTPFNWQANQERTLLIHVKTEGVVQLPLALWSPKRFASYDQARQLLSGMYFGIMVVMLLYNLFMFVGIGDRSYLYYVGFVLSLPLFVSSLTGYSFQYFWPDAPAWNGKSIGLFLSFAVLFAALFTNRFLELQQPDKPAWVRYGMKTVLTLSFGLFPLVMLASYNTMLKIVIVFGVIACSAALIVGIFGWIKQQPQARFYVLAWGSLLLGGIILAGNKFSLLPQNAFTDNSVQIGSSLLVVLLSFAMAERINEEKRKRYRAQMEALHHERRARTAQQEALQAQQDANRQLEAKVKERTEELARANATLRELSARDPLTGLFNRRHLDELLVREYTRSYRHREPMSLVLLDIDHFKRFNDQYGHLVGDDCLRLVAACIEECANRASDTVARYGGEEFCIVLPDTGMEGAEAVAERIRAKIEALKFRVAGKQVPITASLGVASHAPENPEHCEQLVKDADDALYRAKENGRNQVQLARPPATVT